MDEWLRSLDAGKLKEYAVPLYATENEEEAAKFMCREGWPRPFANASDKDMMSERSDEEIESRLPKKYWEQVKAEVFSLVCSKSEKYGELRDKLKAVEDKGTETIVAVIAAYIGNLIGVGAGVLSGFVALALYSVIKIGKEAYCATRRAYA